MPGKRLKRGAAKKSANPRVKNPKESLIDEVEWARIIEVYSRHRGHTYGVAMELGWPVARTRRVYLNGYPSKGYQPIQHILAADAAAIDEIRAEREAINTSLPPSVPFKNEQELEQKATVIVAGEQRRLQAMMRREEDRQRVHADAVKAKAEEGMLISIGRRNALALNAMTAQLLKSIQGLHSRFQVKLEEELATGKMTSNDMLYTMRQAASVARFNAEATVLAVKAERLVLSVPIDTVGEQEDEGSLAQLESWIMDSVEALEKAKKRGLLTTGEGVEPH